MKHFFKLFSLTLGSISAITLLSACGGSNGVLTPLTDTGAGNEQTLNFGSLTTRIAGTAQPPVTSSGSGSTITGIAGAAITSMILSQPGTVSTAQNKILFHSLRNGNTDIYRINPDGTEETRLTTHAAIDSWAQYSPDGSKIAFSSNRDGDYDIYLMNSDGTGVTQVNNNPGTDYIPVWSPDGSKLAFVSERDGPQHIYVMKIDGTDQTPLTSGSHNNGVPHWSWANNKIVFASNRNGISDIFSMNANGTDQTALTSHAGLDTHPSWSPDGNQIVFMSDRDGNRNVHIMNADGTQQLRVTPQQTEESEPYFTPDGNKIVFNSNMVSGFPYQLHIINKDGTGTARLTNQLLGNDSAPRWSWANTKRVVLVGTNGKFGSAAAGFLYGRNGDTITSLLTFDSAVAARASTRIATTTGIAGGVSNYSFTITHPTAITALAYTNDVYGDAITVIGTGANAATSSVLVDYNAATGKVIAVIPFEANRAAEPTQAEGDMFRHRGRLLGVWNAEGKNLAPNGAAEVEVDAKTGNVRVVR